MEEEKGFTVKEYIWWGLTLLIMSGCILYGKVTAYNDGFEAGANAAFDAVQEIIEEQADNKNDSNCTKLVFNDTTTYILSNKTIRK